MKVKLISFLTFCLLGLSSISEAQDISSGYQTLIKTKETVAIDYTFSTYTNQNIFFNQYSIFLGTDTKRTDTIFIVSLNFNKNNNSIEIRQENKQTSQTNSKTIKFEVLSYLVQKSEVKPIYCYKDNTFNDTLLNMNKDNNSTILFTVADTINPIVFLHQILSFDGEYRFDLDKFRKSYLTPHLIHAKSYLAWQSAKAYKNLQDSLSNLKTKAQISEIRERIAQEMLQIDKDKDVLETQLSDRWRNLKLMDTPANPEAQKLFTEKMDKIFEDYFYQTDTLNYEIQGMYKVRSRKDKSKEIVKKITQSSSNYYEFWFKRQLEQIDSTAIKYLDLENEKFVLYSEDTLLVITNKHLDRSKALKIQMDDLNISFDSVFKEKFLSISKDFNNYPKIEEISTVYEYPFKYISISEWEKWVLNKNILSDPLDSVVVDAYNIKAFNIKYPKAKNGKYNVRLNSKIINDYKIGPELDLVDRKYKFVTHLGFSLGTFVTSNKHVEGDETYDGKLTYWNLFLIYHHIGVFGGFNQNGVVHNANLTNYREVGIYLAPGNVFYFKIGLAKDTRTSSTSSAVMPILGASFIFPVFQIEGGYNFALKLPYAMVGFNIPLNR